MKISNYKKAEMRNISSKTADEILDAKSQDHLTQGHRWFWKGDYEKARHDFSVAFKMNPDNLMALFNRGLTNFIIGNHKIAQQDLKITVDLRYDIRHVYNLIPSDKTNSKVKRAALNYITKIMAIDADFPELFFTMGCINHGLGHYRKALKDMAIAIDRDPSDFIAHLIRARSMAKLKWYNKAYWEYLRVIDLNPSIIPLINEEFEILIKQLNNNNHAT